MFGNILGFDNSSFQQWKRTVCIGVQSVKPDCPQTC